MQSAGSFVVAADDPCLDGHFPGNPLVPGVVLLDRALACIGTRAAGASMPPPARLETTKFTAPVLPGAVVDVSFRAAGDRILLACSVDGATVLTASARLAAPRRPVGAAPDQAT